MLCDRPSQPLLPCSQKDDSSHLQQFILHAALDPIDDRLWDASGMNLRVVDKFNDLLVSAYVTAGRTRLLLLHDNRNDDGIHAFFKEVTLSLAHTHTRCAPLDHGCVFVAADRKSVV